MSLLGVRAAIVVVGAAGVLALPAALVLGRVPAKSTGAAIASAAAYTPEGDDHHDQIASRIVRPTVVAAPTATAAAHGGAAATAIPTPRPAPPAAAVPTFATVFVIVMENHEYGDVIGNSAAPYANSLAGSYALATNYYGASHPSLPNYLALTAGSTFGITSDCTACFVNAPNIADQVEASGRSWKAYMEDMPTPCYTGAVSGNYAMKHNPFMYYDDIRTNAGRCASHVVPFTQFTADMSSGRVPNFVWITPNMCNDTHDCAVSTGDAWLRGVVPTITGSSAFRNGGVLFITWDEGSTNAGCCGGTWGGHVPTLVISPKVIPGFRSATAENHYGLLRTIEDAFHLAHLGAAGWSSNVALREYFRN